MTAGNWNAWLDDLPLGDDFSEGIDSLQDFIIETAKRAETAGVLVAASKAMISHLDKWLETGEIATAAESGALYDGLASALAAYEATK